ncbi:hypothetical protein QYZ88_016865 [Lachnospiraceae bacterium C1.1]|nr:hypothetical protein [Lachnospiraceae bacterium C1.1]
MKRKLLALLMVGVFASCTLMGCGGSSSEPAAEAPAASEAPAESEEVAEEEVEETGEENVEEVDAEADAGDAEGSGELTFADLQDNFAILKDLYDKVEAAYMDETIAQSDEVESLLTEAKDVIDQMGELKEEDFESQEDIQAINDSMVTMVEALGGIVDKMEGADSGSDTADSSSEPVFVDGYYANDGNGHDFMIAFYEVDGKDMAYVNDGTDEAVAEYTVENATTDDGTDFLLVTVGGLTLGYVQDGDDVYIVDSEGTSYAAGQLSEAEANELYNAVKQ